MIPLEPSEKVGFFLNEYYSAIERLMAFLDIYDDKPHFLRHAEDELKDILENMTDVAAVRQIEGELSKSLADAWVVEQRRTYDVCTKIHNQALAHNTAGIDPMVTYAQLVASEVVFAHELSMQAQKEGK